MDRTASPTIRPFSAEDTAALVAVHRGAIEALDGVPPGLRASWVGGLSPGDILEAERAGEAFLVAVDGDCVVGFIGFRPEVPEGEIRGLYVDPDHQRRGIGRALVAAAEARIFDMGAAVIAVRAAETAAPAWHAMGYAEAGRDTHVTRGGLPIPVRRMEKPVTAAAARPARNFYGRRKGKHLRDTQEAYLAEDLAALSPGPVTWEENPARVPLDLGALFGGREVWVEIGFGGGEHMVHQAARNPGAGIIGAEPYINGVAMLLGKIRQAGVGNLRVHAGDARDLFDVLPDGSVAKAFLLYPDPWPKARHHRRRFVTPEHLAPLARVMRRGAEFRVATDIPDYVRQTLLEVPRAGFAWQAKGPRDWREPWADWISTRYERKALREGRVPHYLTFRRV